MKKKLGFLTVLSLALLVALPVRADNLFTYGDTTASAGAWHLTSDTSGIGYAGLELQITSGLQTGGLTNLSADYAMTQGSFIGGAPRFTLFDNSFNAAYIYWGNNSGGCTMTDPATGSTGNLADTASSTARVDVNGFGGHSGFCMTYNAFLTLVGPNVSLSYITLDLDGGWANGPQKMDVSSFTVNGDTFAPVPEPASFVLFGSGLSALAAILKKKRK